MNKYTSGCYLLVYNAFSNNLRDSTVLTVIIIKS